jgi:molybdenum cofactor cytidylyltransferase
MISAVVLAAGASRRMGCPKPLVKLGCRTLLQHVISHLQAAAVDEIVVVLGHRAGAILPTLKGMGCRVVINDRYALGMSSSIQRGLLAVDPRARAVLITLGDQPDIPPEVVTGLLAAFDQGKGEIVVPVHGGRLGHPVLFGRRYWPELFDLQGDTGGREVLLRHSGSVHEIAVDAPGILCDIDRPEQLELRS